MERKAEIAHRCLLLDKSEIARGWHLFELEAPLLACAEPGQFVHLRTGCSSDPLLRRPISIHYADAAAGRIRLLVQVSGRGTALLARSSPGEELDLLGPFGRGFPFLDEAAPALFVAGGIGMAPLFFAAAQRQRAGLPFEFILGGRSSAFLPPEEYFLDHGFAPLTATEDGSRGLRGLATALLEKRLAEANRQGRIHACGPMPMLTRVVELARAAGVPLHLSLESRMACGVGACLGCAVPVKVQGNIEYRRVCRDGPVFDGEAVCIGN